MLIKAVLHCIETVKSIWYGHDAAIPARQYLRKHGEHRHETGTAHGERDRQDHGKRERNSGCKFGPCPRSRFPGVAMHDCALLLLASLPRVSCGQSMKLL